MSNPIELVDSWPSLGSGNHSDGTKRHHDWIKSLSISFKLLQAKFTVLEIQIKDQESKIEKHENKIEEQKIEINEQKLLIDELKSSSQPERNSSVSKATFSSILQGNKKKTEAEMVMFTQVSNEFKERDRIEKNIIIYGVTESTSENLVERIAEDQNKVEKILEKLGVDKIKSKRVARLKPLNRPQQNENQTSTNTIERPSLLMVEMVDIESKQLVLSKSRELFNNEEFKNVFVSQDRTVTERTLDKKLRDERKERNSKLPNVETINGISLRYKIENGKRWYWGIRGDRLVFVPHRDDRSY